MSVVEVLRVAGPLLVPLVPAGIALAQGPGKLRSDLKHDAELIALVPEGSDAQKALLAHLTSQIERLNRFDADAVREPALAGFALVTAVGLGYAAVWLAEKNIWWGYVSAGLLAVVVLSCVYGMFESLQRIPRPPKEKKNKEAKSGGAPEVPPKGPE